MVRPMQFLILKSIIQRDEAETNRNNTNRGTILI